MQGASPDLRGRLHPVVFPPSSAKWSTRAFVGGLADLAPEVLAALLVGSMDHRIVREVTAVLRSPEQALKRLRLLGKRFDRLLARAERQRNALAHGTGTTETVLRAVDSFVAVLAQYVAQEAVRQATTGKEPLIEFERQRIEAIEQEARLEVGDSPL